MKYINSKVLLTALLQLSIIAISVVLSFFITREHTIIPTSFLNLPPVHISTSSLMAITQIFVLTYLAQIALAIAVNKSDAFSSKQRFASEYIYYLFAYTIGSLYWFLATTINYDAQVIAGIGLFSTGLYLLFALIKLGFGKKDGDSGNLIFVLFRRVLSVSGVAALLFFCVPLIMGKAFVADRDIANKITQIRIFFNPVGDSEWGLKNYLPGTVFAQPMLVRQKPGDTNNLYILERGGKIIRFDKNASSEAEVVVDVRDKMGEVEVENGALGFAFHPEFENNPYLYLYYTDTRPEDMQYNRISRFDMSETGLEGVNSSETIIMELNRAGRGFHNGGSIEFGPDGYLYIAIGEGVHTKEGVKSSDSLRAGILRIDVNMQSDNIDIEPFEHGLLQGYKVPKDNPFVDNNAIRNEFWALGLRNPFRMNFDSQNGDLWLGEIGSTVWEEVNRIQKGYSYQFPVTEGYNLTGRKNWDDLDLPEQGPVFTYEHNAYDRAVIGGVVNRSSKYETLIGKYVFADNYSAKIFTMDSDQDRVDSVELIARANQFAQRGVSSVTQLDNGDILVTTLGAASSPSGEVLLLVSSDQADVFEKEAEEESIASGYDQTATASSFAVNCARCHGMNGDGKGPDSALLGVPMPNLASNEYHEAASGEDIKEILVKGGAAVGKSPLMPPWGGFLSEQEIDHLVIYVQSLPELAEGK